MSIKHFAIIPVVGMLLLTITGCDINSSATRKLHQEADSLINVAYETKNYDRIAMLADSLRETGGLSEGKAYYWLGYANDRTHKKRLAELYWTKGMTVMDDASTPEDLEVYAAIAFRMNNALTENNDRGMFVTMFIGLLHLDTGRLDYCNCGHNPSVLDGQFLKMAYDNQPLGLWEDDPFEGESIDDIRGRQLFIYTDGLNEAENADHELLGNERLLELMADAKSLDADKVIESLSVQVEAHRQGAEPNDDLTMMCLYIAP